MIDDAAAVSGFEDSPGIERRKMGPRWLDGVGAILHAAALTNQPRLLLQAVANGVRVYATPECGLDPADYLPLDGFCAGSGRMPVP